MPLLCIALLGACAQREPREGRTDWTTTGDVDSDGGAGGSDGSSGDPPGGSGSGDPTGSSTSGASGGSDSGGGDAGGDDGVRFDVGAGLDVPIDPTAGGEGCAKVDFLFVVDNSGSMADEQLNLANSFPGFIAAIRDQVMSDDFHIMVVDTDAGGPLDICPLICDSLPECNGVPCSQLPCDQVVGGGRTTGGNGQSCGATGTGRYLDPGQPDLAGTFSCIGTVGTNGDGNERQMDAMTAAVDPASGAARCNEGFLRSDAILVVTLITDEEDAPDDAGDADSNSAGDPETWKSALVAAKGGDETAIVVLGLIGDNGTPGAICGDLADVDGAEASPRLRAFAESFPFGQWGSVCAPDYTPFFSQAVSVIDGACDGFVPPG